MTKHARERAWERYGLDLSQDDIQWLSDEIAAGRSVLLGLASDGAERRGLVVHQTAIAVLHHPVSGNIISVWPLRGVDPRRASHGRTPNDLSRKERRRRKRRAKDRLRHELHQEAGDVMD
jgi:hypothetical protein